MSDPIYVSVYTGVQVDRGVEYALNPTNAKIGKPLEKLADLPVFPINYTIHYVVNTIVIDGDTFSKGSSIYYDGTRWLELSTYKLPTATVATIGGVSVGTGLSVSSEGAIAADVKTVNGKTGNVSITLSDLEGIPLSAIADPEGVPPLHLGKVPNAYLDVVTTVNGARGDITLSPGANVQITRNGTELTISATGGAPVESGVTTVNGLSGDVEVIAGDNITIEEVDGKIKVNSTAQGGTSGVTSVNTLTGAITFTAGTNITLSPSGNNITINATGGLVDAPSDGAMYARKNSSWVGIIMPGVASTTVAGIIQISTPPEALAGTDNGKAITPYGLKQVADTKVAKAAGYSLVADADIAKLGGIESGAQKNVQADWQAVSGDAYIKNKPPIPTAVSQLSNDANYVTTGVMGVALAAKQNTLTPGDNITISGNTISAQFPPAPDPVEITAAVTVGVPDWINNKVLVQPGTVDAMGVFTPVGDPVWKFFTWQAPASPATP